MWIVYTGRRQSLRRSPLNSVRWMSPTSHLELDPFGAAVARSPHPASGGGGEGSIPLMSPSELGRQWWLWRREAWSAGSRWRLPGSLVGIGEAGENALVRRAGIICKDIGLAPGVRLQADDELGLKRGAVDQRFAGEQRRIGRDARRLCRHASLLRR